MLFVAELQTRQPCIRWDAKEPHCQEISSSKQNSSHLYQLPIIGVQTDEQWDYIDDVRTSNDTRVSLENNAGYTALLTGMNQVCMHAWVCLCALACVPVPVLVPACLCLVRLNGVSA